MDCNLSGKQKMDIINRLPDNLPDPNVNNPYINNNVDLSKLKDPVKDAFSGADEMVRSIPPGQGTGYPPADLGLNLYQLIRELQDLYENYKDEKKDDPCKK